MKKLQSIEEFKSFAKQLGQKKQPETVVRICSTGCRAAGALGICEAFEKEVEERGLQDRIRVSKVGCHGFCSGAPVLVIDPQRIFYQKVKPENVPDIIEKTILGGEIIEKLCYREKGKAFPIFEEIPFYKNQMRNVLARCGVVDPTSIEEALELGAYTGLAKALDSMTPENVIDEVREAGLRGRGGAGFPTGLKWGFCRKSEGDEKYIICNADEGDPGAFMDRAILEGDPHAVLEGMLIGAYAIGATKGFIYCRAEYPIAVEHTEIAIKQMRDLGLLGEKILGSNFSFDIELRMGAGAFVCGEETALMNSVEGKRGEPRPRPPFPAQAGLYMKPTNINNVETWANVPLIVNHGKEWYSNIGTEGSKGTKIFALAGRVKNTGLVEVPMGITLREIVFDIGGGVPKKKEFKAVQTGGPSGGCIPAEHLDLKIDYDSVKQVGAIMGSGGMIVMDETTCMVDIARFFVTFVQSESCGKCVPCRVGTRRMLDTLERISNGTGVMEDIDYLEWLGKHIIQASLCGLGQTAPNPVLSTIRYYRNEYEAHVRDGICPTATCKPLFELSINPEACTGCGICLKNCPVDAIAGEKKKPHVLDTSLCTKCRACYLSCTFGAIEVKAPARAMA